MSHSISVFGKDLYQLDGKDLEIFFSIPQDESAILEFKTGDVQLDKIYKEVCAFLNTDGGVLIIGAPKETHLNGHKSMPKVCQGKPEPSVSIGNQDRLMHSIASNIVPSPTNIRVKSIAYDTGQVYVLDIPKSITPPHQVANEGRYYIRLEREAKPAPHGIVHALMNQRIPVRLNTRIWVKNVETNEDGYLECKIIVRVGNDSPYPANDVEMFLGIIGSVYEVPINKKTVFKERVLPSMSRYLTLTKKADNAMINDLFWTNSFSIETLSDTFYFHLAVWARDSMSISKYYEYSFKDGLKGNSTREESELNKKIKELLGHK